MRSKHLKLFEFAPSKTAFNQILNDDTIQMGFECEMVTNVEATTESEPEEIDYDSWSWSEVENRVRIRDRARDRIEEAYYDWLATRAHRWLNDKWADEEDEYTFKWCIDNGHLEKTEEEREAEDQDVEDIVDTYKDDARHDFDDEFRDEADSESSGDMDDFISDEYNGSNTRLMDQFNIQYDTHEDSNGPEEADKVEVYSGMARSLQQMVGRDVQYTEGLWNNKTRSKNMENWYIEEDGSLDGEGYITAEVSSGVYQLDEGLKMLQTMFQWMKRNRCTTNYSTGMHVSFSIAGLNSATDFDFLKMMVLFDENYTADLFDRLDMGSEVNYAEQMRDLLFKNFETVENPIAHMTNRDLATTITYLHKITRNMQFGDTKGPGMDKYFTFRHRSNGVVEFRSMGGEDYEKKYDIIRKRIVNMAYLMKVGSDPTLMAREYISRIYKILTTGKYKNRELGSGQGRPQPPMSLSLFQTILDRNPELTPLIEKHPVLFLQKLAIGLKDKTINIGPQQIRQLRFWTAKSRLNPDTVRSSFQDDQLYNIIANLMRWKLVVPGYQDPNQQTLGYAQHGEDMSGAPDMQMLNPGLVPGETYQQRWEREQRERRARDAQGSFGGDFNRVSVRPSSN